MIKEITASGKDVTEAKENARAALGVGELDDVQFEVLHAGSRGIFGIVGVKPAQVRAYIELPDREAPRRRNRDKAERDNGENRGRNRNRNGNRNDARRPDRADNRTPKFERPTAQEEAAKPKSAVIPETQLTFTPKTVEAGEDMSFDFVKTLLRNIGLDAEAALLTCEDGTRRINIEGADASLLIGHHGDTLDALQYLANLASAQKNVHGERDKTRVTVDIEGYRAKREETLRALARRMAAKALRLHRSVMLEPMSAYERRIIHYEVQSIEGVSTNSVGSDNNRKIVIYLTDKKTDTTVGEGPSAIPIAEEFPITAEEITPGMNDTVSVCMTTSDDQEATNVAVRAIRSDKEENCIACEHAEACTCILDDEKAADSEITNA